MDQTNINLQLYNLTGQVDIVERVPRFNGNYSSVLLGAWRGDYVAIKVIKATNGQQASTMQRKLLREVIVWGSTSHPNIHPFHGVVSGEPFGPYGALISPWCQNGDAGQYLSQRGASLPMAARIDLWKGVIEGVVYLHDQNPPIVHGDLKPGNVLIDDAGRPRICDFGLARIFDNAGGTGMTTTSEHAGTIRYLAPELVASDISVPPTLASDVYALGCLGLQFIYLQIPFSNRSKDPRGIMILRDLGRGLPPASEPPHHVWPSHRIWQLISELWGLDPSTRPSAFALVQMVTRTKFTFPKQVIQKIIAFVDAEYNHSDPDGDLHPYEWDARTQCLSKLCLVSRAYCTWITPVLYRHLLLRHDTIDSKVFSLNYALYHSIISPLTFNQVTNGYGTYTESFIMETKADELSPGTLSTAFRDLLRMMPNLRLVLVRDKDLGIPMALPSLITLQMEYFDESFVLSPGTIALAFSYLQRLYICFYVSSAPLPAVSASVFLPHLRIIELENHHWDFSFSQFLETFSRWKLPRLQYLDLMDINYKNNTNSLIAFMRSHGVVILYLGLSCSSTVAMPMGPLRYIFPLCVNLRSMRLHVDGSPAFDQLSPHPHLEDLNITGWEYEGEPTDELSLTKFASFKHTAPTLFPKLRHAELTELRSCFKAFFNSGDDFITVDKKNERYRYFDGGRIETNTSVSGEKVNAMVE